MKTIKFALPFFLVACGLFFFSCKKDSSTNTATSGSQKPYQKRWDISGGSSRPAVAARPASGQPLFPLPGKTTVAHRPSDEPEYTGIEFLINSYVIYYSDNTVKAGQYTATNDTTLVLDSLGTLHILSITNTTFSFEIVPLEGTTITLNATVAATVTGNTPADQALVGCTWVMDSTTINGALYDYQGVQESALFSSYGTYLVRAYLPGVMDEYGTNTWKWTDDSHTGLCYGSWDGANLTNCNDVQSVSLSFSDNNNRLVIRESTIVNTVYYLHRQQ